ncbi:unnamed protein product [Symbiodinium sp. CCMP2456]|nr:unnamed protein product [Symbiodinium sp. CCMP2456]
MACNRAGSWHHGLACLGQLSGSGLEANVVTFSAGVAACEAGGIWETTLRLLANMQTQTSAALCDGVYKIAASGDSMGWRRALRLALLATSFDARGPIIFSSLTKMRESWIRAMEMLASAQRLGTRPTVVAYTAVIAACKEALYQVPPKLSDATQHRMRQWPRSLGLFAELQKRALQPDSVATGSVIAVCGAERQSELSLEIFRQMMAETVETDLTMYNILIDACKLSNDADQAFELLEELLCRRLQPSDLTYNHLIACSATSARSPPASELLSAMHHRALEASVVTYNNLLACCKSGRQEEQAWQIFVQMRAESVEPNALTWAALLGRAGQVHGEALLSALEEESNVVVCSAALELCQRLGDSERALEIFSQMQEERVRPDAVTYAAVIDCCLEQDQFLEVQELLSELQSCVL